MLIARDLNYGAINDVVLLNFSTSFWKVIETQWNRDRKGKLMFAS